MKGATSLQPELHVWMAEAGHPWAYDVLQTYFRVVAYRHGRQLLDHLSQFHPPHVVILGRPVDMPACEILTQLRALEHRSPRVLLFPHADVSQDLEGTYYRIPEQLGAPEICRLVWAAARSAKKRQDPLTNDQAALMRQAFDAGRRLAMATKAACAARTIEEQVTEFVGADRVRCLFFDGGAGTLWRPHDDAEFRPPRGLTGYAAAALDIVAISAPIRDGRYCAQIDDPGGNGREHLLVVPIFDNNSDCHAAYVAVRESYRPPFGEREHLAAVQLAQVFAPHLAQLSLKTLVDERARSVLATQLGGTSIYREQAVEAYGEGDSEGQVIRISPRWMDRIFWVLLFSIVGAFAFAALVDVPTYSEGPAVVQLGKDVEVAAATSGHLTRMLVEPGATVRAGDPLMYLFDAADIAEYDRIAFEWSAALRAYLMSNDSTRTTALLEATSRLDAARNAIERKVVASPRDGVIGAPRVRLGQVVEAGQVLLAVVPASAAGRVVVALPGHDHARLEVGQRLRLELDGYKQTYLDLTVASVGESVLSPGEAQRFLGPAAESMQISDTVAIVTAVLPADEFEHRGDIFPYSHGMRAQSAVRVSSETLLAMILPDLGDEQ